VLLVVSFELKKKEMHKSKTREVYDERRREVNKNM
jgi:hypothetical protein